MRNIEVNLNDLLDLLVSGEDFGTRFLLDGIHDLCGKVDKEEIETYAKSYLDLDGYTEEDYEEVKNKLFHRFHI